MFTAVIVMATAQGPQLGNDWLVDGRRDRASVRRRGTDTIVLGNGLVERTFRIGEGAATVGLFNRTSGEEYIRATSPEAIVTIDGKEIPVGGLTEQPDLGYLTTHWIASLRPVAGSLPFRTFADGITEPRFAWKRVRRSEDRPWPPPGRRLTMRYGDERVAVDVVYELYDGMPLFAKHIVVRNVGDEAFALDRFVVEKVAFVEPESSVDDQKQWLRPNWSVMTDYSFGGMSPNDDNNTVKYFPDTSYTTQVNYSLKTPVVMEVAPPLGPGVTLQPGEECKSFTVFTLLHDSYDRERRGLAVRRTFRALAPWTTESPIMLHLTSSDQEIVKTAIDQAVECGFEMVILSFGSGLNMEDASMTNISKWKALTDYAHSKGIQLGGYSLLASRHIDEANDAINSETGKPGGLRFGHSPCLLSTWGLKYFEDVQRFIIETGFDLLEHDGSYPGDPCASTFHPGHSGLADSQWKQFWKIADFYRWCRSRGAYLNVPDTYFFQGSNKTGMGYRETNWSLPRAQQHIHARQNLYDGTWEKPPTMGWMFVPLVQYHGGGAEATIEPLKDHLADYRQHLMNNFGFGAQACYRGPRLFDSPETKKVVVDAVEWFKEHRDILESDIVHLRRADGRRLDAILHVNPKLDAKGMLVVYNPGDDLLTETLTVPLYYTGIRDGAVFEASDGAVHRLKLARDFTVQMNVTVPPRSCAWYRVRSEL